MSEEKNLGGRPLKFPEVKELEEKINEYFEQKETDKTPQTIGTLCIHLDIMRGTLLDYEQKQGFSDTIKKAKERILAWKETQLFRMNGQVTGVIFDLKNNNSDIYKEKQEIDMRASVNIVERDSDDKDL